MIKYPDSNTEKVCKYAKIAGLAEAGLSFLLIILLIATGRWTSSEPSVSTYAVMSVLIYICSMTSGILYAYTAHFGIREGYGVYFMGATIAGVAAIVCQGTICGIHLFTADQPLASFGSFYDILMILATILGALLMVSVARDAKRSFLEFRDSRIMCLCIAAMNLVCALLEILAGFTKGLSYPVWEYLGLFLITGVRWTIPAYMFLLCSRMNDPISEREQREAVEKEKEEKEKRQEEKKRKQQELRERQKQTLEKMTEAGKKKKSEGLQKNGNDGKGVTLSPASTKSDALKRAEETKAALDAKKAADAKAALEAKKAAEAKAAEDAKKAAEAKAAEDAKKADEAKAAEDAKKAAEAKAGEDAKKAAEAKAAEDAKKAAETKAAEAKSGDEPNRDSALSKKNRKDKKNKKKGKDTGRNEISESVITIKSKEEISTNPKDLEKFLQDAQEQEEQKERAVVWENAREKEREERAKEEAIERANEERLRHIREAEEQARREAEEQAAKEAAEKAEAERLAEEKRMAEQAAEESSRLKRDSKKNKKNKKKKDNAVSETVVNAVETANSVTASVEETVNAVAEETAKNAETEDTPRTETAAEREARMRNEQASEKQKLRDEINRRMSDKNPADNARNEQADDFGWNDLFSDATAEAASKAAQEAAIAAIRTNDDTEQELFSAKNDFTDGTDEQVKVVGEETGFTFAPTEYMKGSEDNSAKSLTDNDLFTKVEETNAEADEAPVSNANNAILQAMAYAAAESEADTGASDEKRRKEEQAAEAAKSSDDMEKAFISSLLGMNRGAKTEPEEEKETESFADAMAQMHAQADEAQAAADGFTAQAEEASLQTQSELEELSGSEELLEEAMQAALASVAGYTEDVSDNASEMTEEVAETVNNVAEAAFEEAAETVNNVAETAFEETAETVNNVAEAAYEETAETVNNVTETVSETADSLNDEILNDSGEQTPDSFAAAMAEALAMSKKATVTEKDPEPEPIVISDANDAILAAISSDRKRQQEKELARRAELLKAADEDDDDDYTIVSDDDDEFGIISDDDDDISDGPIVPEYLQKQVKLGNRPPKSVKPKMPTAPQPVQDVSQDDFSKRLKSLKMAYENDLITEEEFLEKKRQLLEQL